MDRGRRRLLPAGKSNDGPQELLRVERKPRRQLVPTACNECRRQKTKCSGERPTCQRCVRHRVRCYYVTLPGQRASNSGQQTLRARASTLEELVELLKTLPEHDVQNLLQRIRSYDDLEMTLKQVKAGDALMQMAVAPATRFRYTLPYRPDMPTVYLGDSPYLESMIHEPVWITQHPQNLKEPADQTMYLRPFHAARVMDARLSEVDISHWTTVCNDNVLMRQLLAGFFRCEYQFTAAFHKDLFLEDMSRKQDEFCSSLLVNIMLGYSCVCDARFPNRAKYWDPNTLLYRFIAEAKRLWELEAMKPQITTIQAGILFNVFHNLCGLDEIGQAYRIQAIALAHQLQLFDDCTAGESERFRKGKAFSAWALYNWETLVGFSFMFPPLLKKPPEWPLPDPFTQSDWYGELWLNYPSTSHLLPLEFGQMVKARSDFRVIMNHFCNESFSNDARLTLQKAHEIHSLLKVWFEGLSGSLLPNVAVLPAHLQLHMYYYHLILTIYEPLLDVDPGLQKVVTDSRKSLQILVRMYYLRHGFEAMDLFIVIPLMVSASDCLDSINENISSHQLEALRSTLILVAQGLHQQRRNHYLAEALFRVVRGRMRSAEIDLLKGTMNLNDDEIDAERDLAQAVRSHWPVSVVKKDADMDSYILTNLVETYAKSNIKDEQD